MENRSPIRALAAFRDALAENRAADDRSRHLAPGRLADGEALAIIDIGSNSVRLVVFEERSRAAAQVFNEKEMAGLGREVASTGRLGEDAVARALEALVRFRILCDAMQVRDVRVIATAAARQAANGAEFIALAERAVGRPIELISGEREANLSALGVISGFDRPDGVVGDLGGGSLELVEVEGARVGDGVSLGLGGLALQDRSKNQIKAAEKIVRDELDHLPQLAAMKGRDFYAVGGTWRALATLHQRQTSYPLNVMHGYTIPTRDAAEFVKLVERADGTMLDAIESVSAARRPLLAYGALVLDHIIKKGRPRAVVISANGVREGLLYADLPPALQGIDPLIQAAEDYDQLRARDPRHAPELLAWTEDLIVSAGLDESAASLRLTKAACLLSDIGWRAHPDYRGEQSLNVIAHAAFSAVDHPGRAFLALTIFHRYAGLKTDSQAATTLRRLLSPRAVERALLLAAAFRVAYLLSAGMPGILPRTPALWKGGKLLLTLPPELKPLASERVVGRLKQLAKQLGGDFEIR